ncbi:MAG: hypothetical protein M0D57_01765 [Sphingobacteriales bacterium JAD_PAG50586_3]|nr:MAG: hypothetical protein M0D57_01765 [Sphingobacteriales bacterium JAD_PAG50586_3]
MKTLMLEIPEYSLEVGFKHSWEDGFKISFENNEGQVVIKANREGLISLAKQLLTLSEENVPTGTHFHLDEHNSLEQGSIELIIERE